MAKNDRATFSDENHGIQDELQEEKEHMNEKCEELVQCQNTVIAWQEKYKHLAADFDNFKKRLEKDRLQSHLTMQTLIFADLLPVLDNIDRAFSELEKHDIDKQNNAWLDGFAMIRNNFKKILEKYGIKEIPFSKQFDPEHHEAILHVASDTHGAGDVVEILEKGYMIHDRVLRPAKVSVAK